MSAQRSIVIGGGAFAGLALALALRQGLGARYSGHCRRSGAGLAAEPRSPRHRHRRGLPPAVRRPRDLGSGRRRGAADHGHGRHRFQAGRRHKAGVPDLCRECRARRAVRAHGREPPSDRRAGRARRGRGHRPQGHRGDGFRVAQRRRRCDAGRRQRDRGEPAGRRRRRALQTARARRASPPMAGTTTSPASSSPSATSAIITAAPRNIFCRRDRSRSCR